jgi:hypothetical protein
VERLQQPGPFPGLTNKNNVTQIHAGLDAGQAEPSNAIIEAALNSQPVLVFGQRPEELRNGCSRNYLRNPEQVYCSVRIGKPFRQRPNGVCIPVVLEPAMT